MTTVLFACVENAGRSQMAAAFFSKLASAEKARALSAGTRPADRIHPEVIAVMKEAGIDLSGAKTTPLTTNTAQKAQVVITMGCGEECPYVPGGIRYDWQVDDPKAKSPEEVRAIRDEIRSLVEWLIDSHGWR